MPDSHVQQHVLVFRLAGRRCAISAGSVREIVPMARLSRPPGMPAILEGFLNLAGSVIPVLRLDRLFGFDETGIELFTPIVIVQCNASLVALCVERVEEVVAIAESAWVHAAAEHSFNGCVSAVTRLAGDDISLLNLDRIVLEKEKQCMAGLQDQERKRLQNLEEARA